MSLRDKILDYYDTLLRLGWLQADEDGNVWYVVGDEKMPATIDGMRLIVPTIEQMKNQNWEQRIGFHPLRESYNLGISPVLANLRDQYVMRINATIAYLMQELIAIGADTTNQKNLNSDQSPVLDALIHCNKNTVATFKSLQKNTRAQNNSDQFINIFIRKGGMVEGKTFGRAGIVTFPIYQKLLDGDDKVNGVKISGKDREMLIKLYRFIFPTIDVPDSFNVGVNTRTAPFLEALIRSTFNVVDDLVERSAPYLPLVTMPTILEFPENLGEWKEIFEDRDLFERLAGTIPNLTKGVEEEVKPARESSSSSRSEPERPREREREREVEKVEEAPRPRGRMVMGDASPVVVSHLGKPPAGRETHDSSNARQTVTTGRGAVRDVELDREEERKRREEADRVQRQRDREAEEDRRRREERRLEDDKIERERRRLQDELDRLEGRGGRSRDRDDRDYDDRDRDRDSRDRPRGRTGDPFDDNPALRANLRDEEDRDRDRGRGRDRYDDRDRGRGRRGGIRDIRHGGGRGRDRDYDDRYDDRDRDYDPRDVRYRGRR